MPALFLNLLKILFLALLYLFLWQVVRAVRINLGGGTATRKSRKPAELVVVRGETEKGRNVKLRAGGHVIGRGPDADIVIDDPYASEFHARVGIQDGKVMVHDLGSTNGTYVNGRRVTTPAAVSTGDTVQIGKTILEVR
jgi:pSer/pThr/pTyr-binding forkhead associated (FHA) protein